MANAFLQLGSLDAAVLYYSLALQIKPDFIDAHLNLAAAFLRQGDVGKAICSYMSVLKIDPGLAQVYANLGDIFRTIAGQQMMSSPITSSLLLLMSSPHVASSPPRVVMSSTRMPSRIEMAEICYKNATQKDPSCANAWKGLGECSKQSGDCETALQYYNRAAELAPESAEIVTGVALTLREAGKKADAEVAFRKAAELRPLCGLTLGNLACSLYERGKHEEAIAAYCRALAVKPCFPEALNNLGNVYREVYRFDDAIACYSACIQLNCSLIIQHQQHIQLSLQQHGALAPNQAEEMQDHARRLAVSYSNLAGVLKIQGQTAESILYYENALTLHPTSETCMDLAAAYKDTARHDDAIASYSQALKNNPNSPEALANLVHSMQCVCDWRDRGTLMALLEQNVVKELAVDDKVPSVQPFHAISFPFSSQVALKISQRYAMQCWKVAGRMLEVTHSLVPGTAAASFIEYPPTMHPATHAAADAKSTLTVSPTTTTTTTTSLGPLLTLHHPPSCPLQPGQRLRIAYISSDFGNHPLSHLMSGVFALHDRSTVEVFCYALSPDDGSSWRQQISTDAEHFLDVSTWSSPDIAKKISRDRCHIAVNLNGYTKGARTEVFAYRPAPVQCAYLGFPASMGAEYIPYIVLDKVVCPESSRHCYSESIAYMPHSYFVNEYRQSHSNVLHQRPALPRSAFGLPQGAVVYSCSNQMYKYDPETFTAWCNILKRVPGSVLWLLRFPPSAEHRIRAEARSRGLHDESTRIIFTDVAEKPLHIARSALADVFLDTPMCNAHTTGCDVLWAGCPVITMPLERMASRVAASLCAATGLGDEMVVKNLHEYEERAVFLGLNKNAREDLRDRLRAARLSCPLFDTARWVRDFEKVLKKMWDIHCEGKGPRDFEVDGW